ncbi:MAG: hypothetical protein MUF23_04360 [Pirellula sp.]|nr:hypothetical protein [Pirellula sp.]
MLPSALMALAMMALAMMAWAMMAWARVERLMLVKQRDPSLQLCWIPCGREGEPREVRSTAHDFPTNCDWLLSGDRWPGLHLRARL